MPGLGLNVKPKKFERWVLLAETLKLGSRHLLLHTFFLLSRVIQKLLTDFSRGSFSFLSLSALSGRPPLSLSRSGDLPFAFLSSLSRLLSLFADVPWSLIYDSVFELFFLLGLSEPSMSPALFLSYELLFGRSFMELSFLVVDSESLRFYNCSLSFIFKIKVIKH